MNYDNVGCSLIMQIVNGHPLTFVEFFVVVAAVCCVVKDVECCSKLESQQIPIRTVFITEKSIRVFYFHDS